MRKHLLQVLIILTVISFSVNAESISIQDLPENVLIYLNKKHPDAKDITVVEKTHFGQSLYEVNFKESKVNKDNETYEQEMGELFKLNGHFFCNVITVRDHSFNFISETARERLLSQYPGYEILAMKLVATPYGLGEEYEIDLLVSGEILNISIDEEGRIISEARPQS